MSRHASTPGAGVLDDLAERGLVHDTTDPAGLRSLLAEPPAVLYLGIDPSAASLHLGNLIGVLVLRRFAEAGHDPIALVGGATGMVGDPSGRSDERNLLDQATLAANLAGIREQFAAFVGAPSEFVVNNHDWTAPVGVLDFLRDVGKHFTVSQMLARESVSSRLASEQGISYTEFSYMLLQAFDFWCLYEQHDCRLQVGGSDQWGNIVAGVDLIRRRSGGVAHGLTWPLLTRADGAKFGKTAEGTIWLSPERTSAFEMHQYLLRTDDADVGRLLAQLTLLPMSTVNDIVAEHESDPGKRLAQNRLGDEVTRFVHNTPDQPDQLAKARLAARALFGTEPLTAEMMDALQAFERHILVHPESLAHPGEMERLLFVSGLCSSMSDARRQLAQSAISVNRKRISREQVAGGIPSEWLVDGRYFLLQRGRRERRLIMVNPHAVASQSTPTG